MCGEERGRRLRESLFKDAGDDCAVRNGVSGVDNFTIHSLCPLIRFLTMFVFPRIVSLDIYFSVMIILS